MSDIELVDPNFTAWVFAYRESIHSRLVSALEAQLSGAPDNSLHGMAVARALASLEPTRETAFRYMMRSHRAAGDTAAALRVYDSLWQMLDQEYEVEPSPATQALAVELKLGSANVAAPASASRSSVPAISEQEKRRLAVQVLPFDLNDLPGDERMVIEGFRFDLMGSLARFRDWTVIDWESVPPRATTPELHLFSIRAKAIGRRDNFRLMLHLLDTQSGALVWSEAIPAGLAEIHNTQTILIRRVAVALNVHISAERLASVSLLRDSDLSIYERWLRGQALITKWRPEDDDRAESLFRSIVQDDPRFAPAYVGIAQILNARHHMLPGRRRSEAVQDEARDLAERAVGMDPLDSRARLCAAWSHAMTGAYDAAELGFSLACDLNQNDPWTLVSSSLGFSYCGQPTKGVELGRQMLDLGLGASPLHWAYHAGVMFMSEQYEACVVAADRAQDATYYLGAWKASALAHLGRLAAARGEFEKFSELVRARWTSSTPPDEVEIIDWLLHCFPIRDARDRERLRAGLEMAASGAAISARRTGDEPGTAVSDSR